MWRSTCSEIIPWSQQTASLLFKHALCPALHWANLNGRDLFSCVNTIGYLCQLWLDCRLFSWKASMAIWCNAHLMIVGECPMFIFWKTDWTPQGTFSVSLSTQFHHFQAVLSRFANCGLWILVRWFSTWTTTSCALEHCVFKFVTSVTKEVFWKFFLSVWPKWQARYFAASRTLVDLMSLHCSCFSWTRYHGQRCNKKRCMRRQQKICT